MRRETPPAVLAMLVTVLAPLVATAQVRPNRVLAPPATVARPAPGAPRPAQIVPPRLALPALPSTVSVPTLSYRGSAVPGAFTTPTLAYAGAAVPSHFVTPALHYTGQAIPGHVTTPALHYIGAARPALERIPLR
jgi:hypothetical protein